MRLGLAAQKVLLSTKGNEFYQTKLVQQIRVSNFTKSFGTVRVKQEQTLQKVHIFAVPCKHQHYHNGH